MTAPIALSAIGVQKRFGGVVAVDDASLELFVGELHALIGPNGAGKTTFIQVLSGAEPPSAGSILLDDADITRLPMHARVRRGLARSYQISSVFPAFTALENVALVVQALRRSHFGCWRPIAGEDSIFGNARQILDEVDLGARLDARAGTLAHGEVRRLELGLALATGARVLLLDEPMAGMDQDDSNRMLELLERLKGRVTILLVEHDMDAVFRLADRISTLVYGRIIATGIPDAIRRHPEVRRAYLGETAD